VLQRTGGVRPKSNKPGGEEAQQQQEGEARAAELVTTTEADWNVVEVKEKGERGQSAAAGGLD